MYEIEVTDTYGGEANYAWVKRGSTRAESRRGKIEAAKRIAGWQGRVRVEGSNDFLIVRPMGMAQVAFVTWRDV